MRQHLLKYHCCCIKNILVEEIRLIFSVFLFLIFSFQVSGQYGNVWYFGLEAGIDFSSGNPVALTNSSMSTQEGSASLADENGNLMFYTDGVTVWNSNHNVMANGSGLLGHSSSTQSAIIVPVPGVFQHFYIFTIFHSIGPSFPGNLHYSIVDLTANAGLGEIVAASKNTLMLDSVGEKMTAVAHANDTDFWVVVTADIIDLDAYSYKSFLVTSAGVSKTSISSPAPSAGISFQGYLKVTQSGDKLACANSFSPNQQSDVYLSDFDNSTGIVSNHLELNLNDSTLSAYGVEFSPNNKFLYVSRNHVSQFDISSGIETTINSSQTTYTTSLPLWGMQLGPDANIYLTQHSTNYLAVIEDPDSLGMAANFSPNAINLNGKIVRAGLPNFYPPSIASDRSTSISGTCENDSTIFTIRASGLDSVLWRFGDPASGTANNSSSSFLSSHLYSDTGTYSVELIIWVSAVSDTLTYTVVIDPLPYVDLEGSLVLCDTEQVVLDVTQERVNYLWSDGSTKSTIEVVDTGEYWVALSNQCAVVSDTVYISRDTNCGKNCSVYIGNVITPNGDGINDLLSVHSDCLYRTLSLLIYNRWGRLVHNSVGDDVFWDGHIVGQRASSGVYFYILEFDERTIRGSFSLFD